ncbi:ATP-binding cassette domain-containing protein [Nocardia sp. IFM 10818]
MAGYDVVRDPAAVRRSIMLTGQFAALDDMLSGFENLVLFGRLQGLSKRAAEDRADELLTLFELTDAGSRRVGAYSGGMRRRIDIACGLVVRPEVVFLDEPTTGLDPRSRQGVWELVKSFRAEGITTLLTTQYLEEADALADRIVVIDRGTVIAEGTPDQLKARTGASYCEIVPVAPTELEITAHVLRPLAAYVDATGPTTAERVVLPAPDGAQTVAEALRLLDSAGIELADIGLRRPSLDDVFLNLTEDPGRVARPEISHAETAVRGLAAEVRL